MRGACRSKTSWATTQKYEASVRESLGVSLSTPIAFRKRQPASSPERSLADSANRRFRRRAAHRDGAVRYIALGANLRFEHDRGCRWSDTARVPHAAPIFAHVCTARLGRDPVYEAWLQLDIGLVELAADRLPAAERALRKCRDLLVKDRGDDHADVSRPLRGLARCALARGRVDEAERLARQAVQLCAGTRENYIGARAQLVLVDTLLARGRNVEAAELLSTVTMRLKRMVGERHIRFAECLLRQALVEWRRGAFERADLTARRCEKRQRELTVEDHPSLIETRLLLQEIRLAASATDTSASLRAQRIAEAEAVLRDLADRCSLRLAADHALAIRIARLRIESAGDDAERRALRTKRHAELVASRAQRLRGAERPTRR